MRHLTARARLLCALRSASWAACIAGSSWSLAQNVSPPPIVTPNQSEVPTGQPVAALQGGTAQGGTILGTVKAGAIPLPGASVTATNTLTGKRYSTTTDITGAYRMNIPQNGRYVVRVELAAFAAETKEALLNATARQQQVDVALVLASRVVNQPDQADGTTLASTRQYSGRGAQSLNLQGAAADLIAAGAGGTGTQLPSLAGNSDFSGDSVAVSGQTGTTNPFAGINGDQMRQGFENEQQQQTLSQVPGQTTGGGAAGGGGGFFGGGGGGFGGGGGGGGRGGNFRNFKPNQPHGSVYWTGGNSALDARSYALDGQNADQPGYSSDRFGLTLIASPYVPKLMKKPSAKDILFLTLFENRASRPSDQYVTVPTLAERGGDFSGLAAPIYDPKTGRQFARNVIDPGRISPLATALLAYIPEPNLAGDEQNYHRLTTAATNSTTFGTRWIHNFGPSGGSPMAAMMRQFSGTGLRQNANANFNYTDSSSDNVGLVPALNGKSRAHSYSLALGYTLGRGKLNNNFTLNWNRSHSELSNTFTGGTDIASQIGILGPGGGAINSDPLNYGLPNISLGPISGISETQPSFRTNQTISFSLASSWNHAKHNVRWGGDFRRVHLDLLGGANTTGSFGFTGLYTQAPGASTASSEQAGSGSAFADFLLDLPQESTIQAPQQKAYMRANSWDAYLQDDWRVSATFTILAGLRYEYFTPYSEKYDRLATLDPSADFTQVAEVHPNQVGPYSGRYNSSLIQPYKTALSPRLGFALRPMKDTVVRGGYAINYTNGQYATFIQNLAYQPPFADVQTNQFTLATPGSFEQGLSTPQTIGNYSVNKNYRLPYVQVWNLNVQRTIPLGIVLNVGYSGAKGTHLSILDAPRPFGNAPVDGSYFTYENSVAFSNYNSLVVSAQKRLQRGVSLGATYTYSHSIDNASSIGGGSSTCSSNCAQNWQNLVAEESNSSFDLRHQLKGRYDYELPFGPDKHLLSNGSWISHAASNWSVSGDFTFSSGSPLSPTIAPSVSDTARATAGSVRPDRVPGVSITAGGGSRDHWFNTAAFSPDFASGQQYGTASRYSITGPGTVNVDMALSKSLQFSGTRNLEFRATAENAFNIVQYSGIDTQYGSPALGQVVSTRGMRAITVQARFRF